MFPLVKTISMMVTKNTPPMAIAPGMAGYCSFQNGGRQGSRREMKAVGTRWTKAVAIKTPVPKCRAKKRKVGGMRRRGNRLHMSGKLHAVRAMVSMVQGSKDGGGAIASSRSKRT